MSQLVMLFQLLDDVDWGHWNIGPSWGPSWTSDPAAFGNSNTLKRMKRRNWKARK